MAATNLIKNKIIKLNMITATPDSNFIIAILDISLLLIILYIIIANGVL
jgi:hypothetical protein